MRAIINKELFKDLVRFYQSYMNMTLLESKVYACLLLDYEREGLSFEELLNLFMCSKSSLSSILNSLIDAKKIEFYYKTECRKRFFRLNDLYLEIRLRQLLKMLQEEIWLAEALMADQKTKKIKNKRTVKDVELYAKHLYKSIENMSLLVGSISKTEE
ncbi:MAG: hypothetical protein ACK5NK_11570 [Niabella sp.]